MQIHQVERVKLYCDIREINGYTVHEHPVYHNLTEAEFNRYRSKGDHTRVSFRNPITAILYVGTPDNPQFVGPPASPTVLAQHILNSRGPSGENKEYLYKLQEALEELAPEAHDDHVKELCDIAMQIEEGRVVERLGGGREEEESEVERLATERLEDKVMELPEKRERASSVRERTNSFNKPRTFAHLNYGHGRRPSQVEEPIEENEK